MALLQTPAVFEQHTTTCLKISRVEIYNYCCWAVILVRLAPSFLSMLHAAASCCLPTPLPHAYLHKY